MSEVLEETSYERVGFPGSFPNRKSLLGLVPASVLLWLGISSLAADPFMWGDYESLGLIWIACGAGLAITSVFGFRGIDTDEKSIETSLLLFCWACADALLLVAFAAGSQLPHNDWLGLAYAGITVPLMHTGVTFMVWDILTGVFGAFAKAMAVAMGAGALVAASVVSILMNLEVIIA